jgi:hypothetical protein
LRIGFDQLFLNPGYPAVSCALALFQHRRNALLNVDACFHEKFEQTTGTRTLARLDRRKVVSFCRLTLMQTHQ